MQFLPGRCGMHRGQVCNGCSTGRCAMDALEPGGCAHQRSQELVRAPQPQDFAVKVQTRRWF